VPEAIIKDEVPIIKGGMMMKKLWWIVGIFCGLAGFFITPQVRADSIPVTSNIADVTIYPGGALVTRQAEFDLPAGDHTILFDDIVPAINENTLTVKGQGSARVKIFGAFIKTEYLTRPSNERVKALQDAIEQIDDEIVDQNNKLMVLDKQRDYLDSVKLFSAGQIPKDLVTKMPSVSDLEQLNQYVSRSFTDIETQGESIRQKLRELNRKRGSLDGSLQELNANVSKLKRSIAVDLQAVSSGKLTLSVSYFVMGVNWQPVYDARVLFEKKQVGLSLFGLIQQSTGEDWNNVNLTISTSRPSLGGVMPQLNSWVLRPFVPENRMYAPMAVAAGAMGSLASPALYETMGDQAKKSAFRMMQEVPQAAVFAYAQTEEKGATAVFKITRRVNIKSDGSRQRVPIMTMDLPAQFEYASTPKLSPYAFLRSRVNNNQQAVLLPGRVNVFLDGDYVGNSAIPKALGQKEQFDLYLGVDEGVMVKRELVEEKTDDVLFANIPSPNKVVRYSYKITVENYKKLPIMLNLFDQVPVSQDEKIKVKDVTFSIDPAQKDYESRKGVMRWMLSLNPAEKKEISYSFAIERPRDLQIAGQ